MPKNLGGPIRRSQLISPFGVGAMVVVPGGTSLIISGLDTWYEPRENSRNDVDVEEFKVYEWRLQKLLGVDHFRLPPDHRDTFWSQGVVNAGLTIPSLRFPAWHFCPSCRLLYEFPMYASGKRGKLKCPECEKNKKTRYMSQVRFIAMCDSGHVQDFPWREWVHRHGDPSCRENMRLISMGSATLGGQMVRCGCGKERSLNGITTSYPDHSTFVSRNLLDNGDVYLCPGKKTWLGEAIQEKCSSQLRGSLRNASNLYFAQIASSIYIPVTEDPALLQIENLIQNPPISTILSTLSDVTTPTIDQMVRAIRKNAPRLVVEYSDAQVSATLDKVFGSENSALEEASIQEDDQTAFRRAEYEVLRTERNDDFLKIKKADLTKYSNGLGEYFSKIMHVSKMRETRVLTGFTRVFAENTQGRDHRQSMLWQNMPEDERWLPAYTVFGEGLYFELSEERVKSWEQESGVVARIASMQKQNSKMQTSRHLRERDITARFVLLHTFSHLLMNRLTFECGYSSAALRERIYVSNSNHAPMCGVLIYTADGDSEGTMGGLVRMGKPGNLEPVLIKAIENAKWCSSDPICMELGSGSGQGPDSCNLAACHNCALVPETACEEFNRFLDRGVIVGDFEGTINGYFDFI